MIARWKIVVFIESRRNMRKKRNVLYDAPLRLLHCVCHCLMISFVSGAFCVGPRYEGTNWSGEYFCGKFSWMTKEDPFVSIFGLNDSFFYSITCSTASPYTCHHSKIISHIHSAFHVILRFSSLLFLVWISKRNSRIFYVFLFTAPLLKSWKMKMNTSFLHRVFQSFFFVIRKKSSVWIRNWSTRKTNVSLTYVQLYVGAWASRWRYFELHIC